MGFNISNNCWKSQTLVKYRAVDTGGKGIPDPPPFSETKEKVFLRKIGVDEKQQKMT